MAKIYPKFVDDFHGSYGENQIFESLKKLNDDWIIIHSVNWQKQNINGRISWGEADFLIMNQNYGILVVEVKSGGISYKDGNWYQTRFDNGLTTKMKNPFSQANRSKYKIKDLIEDTFGYSEKVFVDKIVWFPSITKDDFKKIKLPLEYNENLILTKDSLSIPEQSLKNSFRYYNSTHFNNISNLAYEKIFNMILPEFNLIPALSSKKDEIEYRFAQLTKEQEKVLEFVEFQNTIAIEGSAGTGKTFIALEYARRNSEVGKVLFLCFNRYLYKFLESNYICNNVEYYNIHSFISNKNNKRVLLTDNNMLKELKEIDFSSLNYNFIVIDEAQDFDFNIIKYLYELSIDKKINFVIFYDKNQQVIKSNFSNILKDFDCKLTLKNNCRNTIKIQSTINSIFNLPLSYYCYSIEGRMPNVFYSENKNNIIKDIEKKIDSLLSSGYTFEDITILTLKTEIDSLLYGVERIGRYKISSNLINNESIFFTTSKKFKGLESNVIIVIDYDFKNKDEEYIRNYYVSTSRAKMDLIIYSSNSDSDIKEEGYKINPDFSPLASISSKYKVKIKKLKNLD